MTSIQRVMTRVILQLTLATTITTNGPEFFKYLKTFLRYFDSKPLLVKNWSKKKSLQKP